MSPDDQLKMEANLVATLSKFGLELINTGGANCKECKGHLKEASSTWQDDVQCKL